MSLYRYINTEPLDAALNMAVDEAILTHYLQGEAPPTLRTFRWTQTAITLGRFQHPEREFELERCQEQSIALVRRPTGGRAVYHRDEFTYSLVIGKRENVPSGVVAAYAYLAQGLQAALQHLGIASELSEEHVSKNPSAACFASSTQADLTAGGFKIIGSAQVWKNDALLQQGSLPLDDHAIGFFALLRFPTEAARAEALALYQTKTTPLHAFMPDITREQIAAAFVTGFGAALHTQFVQEELSASEWTMARQLVEEKYNKLVWAKERITLV